MELSIYDIIKKAVISSKSVEQYQKSGKVTFEVHKEANKLVIRDAVEKIWNVKVAEVRVINKIGKNRIVMRRKSKGSDKKKAIITLKKGYKIEIPGMVEALNLVGGSSDQNSVAENE